MLINLNESQLYEQYNQLSIFDLCYNSQELIQDLISKTAEFVSFTRHFSHFLIVGDQATYMQRKAKVEDILKTFETTIQRLRVIVNLVHNRKLTLEKQENNKQQQIQPKSNLDQLKAEKEQLIEQIRSKNKYIKESIDQVSNIIWQINAMQTLKQ